jgi:uncharacterized protein YybS (DUF2232 family)
MMLAVVNYFIAAAVLRYLRYNIPRLPRFADWRMDWRFSWGLILGLLCMFLGGQMNISWLDILGRNILYCFAPVLIVCGVAFIAWYFRFIGAGMLIKALAVLLSLLFFTYSAVFFILLAVFDPLLDMRGRLQRLRDKVRNR